MYIIQDHRDESFLCCSNASYPQRTAYWCGTFSNYVILFETADDAKIYANSVLGKGIFKGHKLDICEVQFLAKYGVG